MPDSVYGVLILAALAALLVFQDRHIKRLHERLEDRLVDIAIAMRDDGADVAEIKAHVVIIRAHGWRDHLRALWAEYRGRRDHA